MKIGLLPKKYVFLPVNFDHSIFFLKGISFILIFCQWSKKSKQEKITKGQKGKSPLETFFTKDLEEKIEVGSSHYES